MPAIRLTEWAKAEPVAGSALAGRRLDDAAARAVAAALAKTGRLQVVELAAGLQVSTYSFVGRVEIGSLTVTVEPKLAAGPLLALVRYAHGLRDLRREGSASYAMTGSLLPDLLAVQLASEVTDLVARGLPRRYVERAEALSAPRGRIDIGAHARRATPCERLPCRHHVRSADHAALRAIRAGLELAAVITTDSGLRMELHRLRGRLGVDVSSTRLTRASVARVRRSTTRLEGTLDPALQLVELLVEGRSLTLDDATTIQLPGFLFDMNRFFQALVGRWLREQLPDAQVLDERALSGLLAYSPGYNPRGVRAPAPRPDFAVRVKRGRPVILVDAKYRDLWERSLPRQMLYQLAMYATSGAGDPLAVIVFPTEAGSATEARIDIRDVVCGAVRGRVALRPVNLHRLADLVRSGSAADRRAEAERLVSGVAG